MNTTYKSNTASLLLNILFFTITWLIAAGVMYLVIVVPFFPDSLEKTVSHNHAGSSQTYIFFLLNQLASLLGAIFTFWVLREKVGDSPTVKKIVRFDFSKFCLGGFFSIAIIILCCLMLIAFNFVSIKFVTVKNTLPSLIIFSLVSVTEEVVFRGYVIEIFKKKMSTVLTIFFSSLIFSLIHFANPSFGIIGFTNIFLSGIFLAQLYLRFENLSMPIGAHLTWNLTQNLLGFAVSGQNFEGDFRVNYETSSTYVTGGEFGIEGSILCTGALLIAIAIYGYRYKNSVISNT